jgi:hypothetical protein
MLEFIRNIPYYCGKHRAIVARLQQHAPSYPKASVFALIRLMKWEHPDLTMDHVEAYLAGESEECPLFEARMTLVRESDGERLEFDTLWALDGYVTGIFDDDSETEAALLPFLQGTVYVTGSVALKEDASVTAEVIKLNNRFHTPDVSLLKAWYQQQDAEQAKH